MKKISIVLLLVIVGINGSLGQVNFGVKAGLNISSINGLVSSNQSKAKLGLNAGFLASISVAKKITLQPEILYSDKGYRYSLSDIISEGTLSFNYLSVPLLVGFQPDERFTILAGPELGYLIKANSKFDNQDVDVSDNFRKIDVGLNVGLAYRIVKGFGLELRYCHGFGRLVEGMIVDQYGAEIGHKKMGSNRAFQLGAFYRFSNR